MKRAIQLERGRIDLETGVFPLIATTNGEASDGHILNLAKMEVAERTPMFVNHIADPVFRMGGLIHPKVTGKTTQLGKARLHMQGVIDMNGDTATADIRRDVAQGISVGDITQMSVRWDELEAPIPRADLPKDHFAFSDRGVGAWNTPLFFPSSALREVSIVGLAADQAAIIGRARDTGRPTHVREFWEVMIRAALEEQTEPLRAFVQVPGVPEGTVPIQDGNGRDVSVTLQMQEGTIETFIDPTEQETIEDVCAICAARDLEQAETAAQSAAPREEPAAETPPVEPLALADSMGLSDFNDTLPDETLEMIRKIRAETDARIAEKFKAITYRKLGRIY